MTHTKITLASLTPAARRAVLSFARGTDPELAAGLAIARSDRKSRATDVDTVYGSGSSRRVYTSTVFGTRIDTESANWPITAHAMAALAEHRDEVRRHVRAEHPKLVAEITAAVGGAT